MSAVVFGNSTDSTAAKPAMSDSDRNVNHLLLAVVLFVLSVVGVCLGIQVIWLVCRHKHRTRRRYTTLMSKHILPYRNWNSAHPLLISSIDQENVEMATVAMKHQEAIAIEDAADTKVFLVPPNRDRRQHSYPDVGTSILDSELAPAPRSVRSSSVQPSSRSDLVFQNASVSERTRHSIVDIPQHTSYREELNLSEASRIHRRSEVEIHREDDKPVSRILPIYETVDVDGNGSVGSDKSLTVRSDVGYANVGPRSSFSHQTTSNNSSSLSRGSVTATGGENIYDCAGEHVPLDSSSEMDSAVHYENAFIIRQSSNNRSNVALDGKYDDTVIAYSIEAAAVEDEDYDDVVGPTAASMAPYVEPPDDEQSIYDVFKDKKFCYIPRESVKTSELIGKGFFASVYKGTWDKGSGKVGVAVKTLNRSKNREDRVTFLQEAAIIGQFNHPHIIKLLGVIADDKAMKQSCALVFELMPGGDLKKHLHYLHTKVLTGELTIIGNRLLLYARQIAAGMYYLSSRRYIHRDLAARNILLTTLCVCKIGDFGLSKNLNDSTYYKSVDGIVPWKWTAPEALEYGRFSSASDVWSFGCVLFEIFSLGMTPMANVDKFKIIEMLKKAYKMPPPSGCPPGIHRLIKECWNPNHEKRPKFSKLCRSLKRLETLDEDDISLYSGMSSSASLPYFDLQTIYEDVDIMDLDLSPLQPVNN